MSHKKQLLETIICPHCGKEFKPFRSNQIYCCRTCKEAESNKRHHQRIKGRPKQAKTYVCEFCHEEFTSTRKRRFCCRYCASKAYRFTHNEQIYEQHHLYYLRQKALRHAV